MQTKLDLLTKELSAMTSLAAEKANKEEMLMRQLRHKEQETQNLVRQMSGPRQAILASRLLASGLGKSRQVGHDKQSWNPGYWHLG